MLELYIASATAFDGNGPSLTCHSICDGFAELGARPLIYGARVRPTQGRVSPVITPYGNLARHMPWRLVHRRFRAASEAALERDIPDGAVVYAWPTASAALLQRLKGRGCFIALELINQHTLTDKRLLDAEWAREGFDFPHAVTPARIDNQIAALAVTDIAFAPNPHVRLSLIENGFPAERVIETRYATADFRPGEPRPEGRRLRFITVGTIEGRKGCHHLLRAWQKAAVDADLVFFGNFDPPFREAIAPLMEQPNVEFRGYTAAIHDEMRRSDGFIFLTLSEGGPQVTIEAAAHGLPLVVSPLGAARLAEDGRTGLVVEPRDTDAVAEAIRRLAGCGELRARLGAAAAEAARAFTWRRAAEERLEGILRFARPETASNEAHRAAG